MENNFKKFIKIMNCHMDRDFVIQYFRFIKSKNLYDDLIHLTKVCPVPGSKTDPMLWLIFTFDIIKGFKVSWITFFEICCTPQDMEKYFNKKYISKYNERMKYHCPNLFYKNEKY